jgi:hypothetical protein
VPTAQFPKVHDDVRNGLTAMKTKMLGEADRIRTDRLKNGLENR